MCSLPVVVLNSAIPRAASFYIVSKHLVLLLLIRISHLLLMYWTLDKLRSERARARGQARARPSSEQ